MTPMNITAQQLQQIVEAALMVAGRPLTVQHLQKLFDEAEQPETSDIRSALAAIREYYQQSGIELQEVASGFQFQAKTELSPWLCKLWEERPPRYSRALLETLALIAYRQPVTRAEVEEIRGVTASSHIIKTLLEREWIKVMGYRDVPGKPAIYGTTKAFLDHFNLKDLSDLPTLAEIKDLEGQEAKLQVQLELNQAEIAGKETLATEFVTMIEEHIDIITGTNSSGNLTITTEAISSTELISSEELTIEQSDSIADIEELTIEQSDPTTDIEELTIEQSDPTTDIDKLTIEQSDPTTDIDKLTIEQPDPSTDIDKLTIEQSDPSTDIDESTIEQPDPTTDVGELTITNEALTITNKEQTSIPNE